MKKRTKISLGCLGLMMLFVLIVVGIYGSIVWMPSRYPAFEKTQTDTLKKVREAVRPRPAATTPARPATIPAHPAASAMVKKTVAPGARRDSLNELAGIEHYFNRPRPGDSLQESSFIGSLNSFCRSLYYTEDMTADKDWNHIKNSLFFFSDRELVLGMPESGEANATRHPGIDAAIIKEMKRWKRASRSVAQRRLARPDLITTMVQRQLDVLEQGLAHIPYDQFPEFDDYAGQLDAGLPDLTELAVIRACEREEWERATRILENYLELIHRIHLASFPGYPYNRWTNPFDHSRSILAAYEQFPEEKLARIQHALEAIRLTPKQIEEFRKADAIRIGKRYRKMRAMEAFGNVKNTWHFFENGKPEQLAGKVLAPVLDRQMEELVMAWVKGDPGAIRQRERAVEATRRLMNLHFSPLRLYYESDPVSSSEDTYIPYQPTDESREWVRGVFINDGIDLSRIVVAVLRYRRALGHYPDSLTALANRFLDGDICDPVKSPWRVYRISLADGMDGDTSTTLRPRINETFAVGKTTQYDGDSWRPGVLRLFFPQIEALPKELQKVIKNK